jgi:type IV pilus assembly protein PilW
MKCNRQNRPAHQHGLSLIELMIAMVLGLLLMSGVISIFLSAKQGYINQDATAQLQENARFALDMMTHEIRMAGFGGCSDAISVANTLDGDAGLANNYSEGLRGYEGDASNSTFPAKLSTASPNTDAIIIHTIDSNSNLGVDSHNPNAATIHLSESHSIKPGAILLLVDSNCSNMAIFANTGPTNNTNNATNSNHNTGNLVGYGYENCTKKLKGNFDCSDTSGAQSVAYSAGSSLFTVESLAYYIAPSAFDASVTSLYRLDIDDTSDEMVEGISNLEIFYGVATSTNIQYLKPSAISADQWVDVKSVRLILTSNSLTLIDGAPLTKTFTSTVKLRNRGESL